MRYELNYIVKVEDDEEKTRGMSVCLESVFLIEDGRTYKHTLWRDSILLPKSMTEDEAKALLGAKLITRVTFLLDWLKGAVNE